MQHAGCDRAYTGVFKMLIYATRTVTRRDHTERVFMRLGRFNQAQYCYELGSGRQALNDSAGVESYVSSLLLLVAMYAAEST